MPRILVIDDEKSIRNTLKDVLEYEKYEVSLAEDGASGIDLFAQGAYDVVLCDIKMAKMDGIEVLQKLLEISSDVPVIMISGHGNIDTAVDSIKKGAFDFLEKPLDLNRLLITIRNALERGSLISQTKVLKKQVSKKFEIVGNFGCHHGGEGDDRQGCSHGGTCAHHRRQRYRQGACCPPDT